MALSDIIPWRDRRDELARPGEPFSTLQTQINRLFDDFSTAHVGQFKGVPFLPYNSWQDETETPG